MTNYPTIDPACASAIKTIVVTEQVLKVCVVRAVSRCSGCDDVWKLEANGACEPATRLTSGQPCTAALTGFIFSPSQPRRRFDELFTRNPPFSQICALTTPLPITVITMTSWREEYIEALKARDETQKLDYNLIDACERLPQPSHYHHAIIFY